MIDLENVIFTELATTLRDKYGENFFVAGEYVESPASFPAVTIVEADNRVLQSMRTLKIENAVSVMYEINIYSNKTSGKKSEAKEIADVIDKKFEEIGFTRTMRNQVANLNNASIFRMVCRYEAVIDKDHWIYQN